MALALCGPAAAQVSGSIALETDYRLRGYSLSGRQPVAILNLAYDSPSGVYLNGSTIGLLGSHDTALLGAVSNIGYARRLSSGLSLDGGVSHSEYFKTYNSHNTKEYTELYVGFFRHNISSYLYYSPDYFTHGVSTLYGEVNTFFQPVKGLRLNAHAGYLGYLSEPSGGWHRSNQYDWRLSASHPIGHFDLHAALSGGGPGADYYYDHTPRSKTAFVVGASWTF